MKRESAADNIIAPSLGTPSRCICCGGTIEIAPDEDISVGLNLALGLVSDECALLCDGCTSRLIAERQEDKPVLPRRR
jgi:hypothetical protein